MLGLLAAKPLVEHAAFLLVVMIAYLLLMLLLGYIAGRKTTDNSDDYMAAEGKMPFWLVTATILATFICGATIMGGGGVAYSDGFAATIADPFAACLCLIAGGFIFQGQIRRTGAVSPAAVYQNRYGVLGGVIAGVCTIMPMLFFAGAQVAATGKLFQIVLGWPFRTTAILSGIFVIVYTAFGGITAVVWTDFAQVLILIIGVIVSTLSVGTSYYRHLRGQLDTLLEKTTEEQKDVTVTIHDTRVRGNDVSLPINDLLYVEAQKNNVVVGYVKDGKLAKEELQTTLAAVLSDLGEYGNVFQCHRSFIVNLNNISSAKGNSNGYVLELGGGLATVPVSRSFVPKLKSFIA